VKNTNNNNDCITLGIKASSQHKRELDLAGKKYYKLYSKILSNVIKETKKVNYNRRILKSSNNNKSHGTL